MRPNRDFWPMMTAVAATVALVVAERAAAGAYATARIEPEITAPRCQGLAALAPWSGCHVPGPNVPSDGDGPDLPVLPPEPETPPISTPPDPCAGLWTPGRHAVVTADPCR